MRVGLKLKTANTKVVAQGEQQKQIKTFRMDANESWFHDWNVIDRLISSTSFCASPSLVVLWTFFDMNPVAIIFLRMVLRHLPTAVKFRIVKGDATIAKTHFYWLKGTKSFDSFYLFLYLSHGWLGMACLWYGPIMHPFPVDHFAIRPTRIEFHTIRVVQ
jgi:hypothetical protein